MISKVFRAVSAIIVFFNVAYGFPRSCMDILTGTTDAPSGVYQIFIDPATILEVYCEMGLNGGGYTFLSPQSLAVINDTKLQSIITDRKTLLMRIRKCDGTQPYVVLEQLPQFYTTPIKFSLNNWVGYHEPLNLPVVGGPYLYAGFIPKSLVADKELHGVKGNGVSHTFTNCGAHGNSYIALFPNFGEKNPTSYGIGVDWPFCNAIFNGAIVNPSTRIMPPEYYMFGEFHFGGCGCYTQPDSRLRGKCIQGFHIGFR